ncbi:M48 family metallopeptidase [Prosthecobacter sp.]|uniref:M48 family metallopeptidase n=1 Tax=Prosthecobacter sp. TaxID=1965333 RepID=UPI003783F1C4
MPDTAPASPLDAFSGRIEPTRVPLLYQFGLAFVALAMVLLPLIYIALIIAVGWLVWWHLQNDIGIITHARGRAAVIALVVYLAPAVAGGIFILFLVKPLFSRSTDRPQIFKITPAEEPLLFAFVAKICQLVGAPEPREIRLDTQVNASAGFRRGWLSFFGSDLVLVIGLPLAAGMTARQLAGVLAHEFGHFAQGAGMRLSYIIRSVNAWFARVVFERDHWDEKLEEWSQSEEWWIKLIFMLAKGGVWVGRKVLWCLMHLGHAISCFMSRQMEYDADSYEAKLAGSAEFARTAARLRSLGFGHAVAMNDAYQTYQSKELPDDLPAMVLWREKNLPAEVQKEFDKHTAEAKTSWNDTHPADPDRVKAALAWQAPGVFQQETPAAELFADFTASCQNVTRHFFEHILEVPAGKVQFRSTTRMVEDRQSADASDQYLEAFYGKNFHLLRIQSIEPGCQGTWREAVDQMEPLAATYGHQLAQLDRCQEALLKQVIAGDLITAGFTLSEPGQFSLASSTKSGAEFAIRETNHEMQQLAALMSSYETGASRRLAAALDWWQSHHEDEASRRHLERLLVAQRALASGVPNMMQASRTSRSLQLLFDNAANHSNGYELERQARAVAQRIEVATSQCMTTLGDAEHPYLSGHPPIAQALHLPDQKDNEWARAFQLANVCTEALVPLLVRIMGDLCGLALAAEKEMKAAASQFTPPEAPPPEAASGESDATVVAA